MKKDSASIFSASLKCVLPTTAVPDTTSAEATVVGDLMGDMLNNLEGLIQMSYGCGEQNLLNLVPDIVALIYLEKTGKITDTLRSKAIAYAEDGYQRQLTYRHSDGSFSAFGESDPSGSTWLTAYTIKTFLMARPYIAIDSNVITTGMDYFINQRQNSDGSFREEGNVIHKDMQGGSSAGLAMTAYVSIVLSEIMAEFPSCQQARDKALDYIALNLDTSDIYAVAISSYALYLGNHAKFNDVYAVLLSRAIETPDMIRWEKPITNPPDQNCWWWNAQPRSVDIEMTSYALLLILNKDLTKAVKIAKFLVSQKNAFGGYGSSQDTVVGVKSLADFSVKFNAAAGTMNIVMTPDLGAVINAQVNPTNMVTLQSFTLNNLARQLAVSTGAGSTGSAIVSLTCRFYEITDETKPRFVITHQFIRSCKNFLRSHVCLTYIARDGDAESNMALVTMTLLSGYTYDSDTVLDKNVVKVGEPNLISKDIF